MKDVPAGKRIELELLLRGELTEAEVLAAVVGREFLSAIEPGPFQRLAGQPPGAPVVLV